MSALPGWPGNRDGFCPVFIWEISSRLPRWKNVQRLIKIPEKRLWERVSARNSNQLSVNKPVAPPTAVVFVPLALSAIVAMLLQLNGFLLPCNIQQARLNLAIQSSLLRKRTYLFLMRNWISLVLVTGLECSRGKDFQHGCRDPDNRAIWPHRKFYEGKSGEAKPSQFGWPAHMKRL